MKKLMILGAIVGLSTGVLFGFVHGTPWPDVLWRASIACFAASYLFRWWGRAWLSALRQSHLERSALSQIQQPPPANV